MKQGSPELLRQLQHSPECIRNICILAHVDHGKTSLADALVAKNGIISARMAGKLRYMDSREDEQMRGITMKSSGISIGFTSPRLNRDFLINLIDTPGHVDFSSEVSTAVRICDGALVVVDVVEGVCPQTYVVLKQAWQENIRPVLVLNKIDRLILEVKMSPLEAYRHIQKVLTDVNAATGELFTSDVLARRGEEEEEEEEEERNEEREEAEKKKKRKRVGEKEGGLEEKENVEAEKVGKGKEESEGISFDATSVFDQIDDSKLYFSPDQGNVIFASAIDGWGFGLDDFVDLYSKKLKVNARVIRRTLWGDYFLNVKTKKIQKGAAMKAKKPLFVQFVLENLWSVYDAVLTKRDKNLIEKITSSLNLKILPRDSRNADPRVHLQAICGQWLPLADAALDMVCRFLPSPLEMTSEKIHRLMAGSSKRFDDFPPEIQDLSRHFQNCRGDETESPTIAFVSKVFAIESSSLPSNKKAPMTREQMEARKEEARKQHSDKMRRLRENPSELIREASQSTQELGMSEECETKEKYSFVALARVYAGCLRKGQRIYALGPKHDPVACLDAVRKGRMSENLGENDGGESVDAVLGGHASVATVGDVFLLMGRDLELVEEAAAGNVVGIGGLESHVLRSATLSSTPLCPPFTDLWAGASKPIVRVAVEPQNPSDVDALIQGMKMLNQADPCVQVVHQETGEHVLMTAGEVHLERCVKDLKECFAKIPLNVSSPIVPFRETIVEPPKVDRVNERIASRSDGDSSAEAKIESLTILTPNKEASLEIKLEPIPKPLLQVLEANPTPLKLVAKSSTEKLKSAEKSAVRKFYRRLVDSAASAASGDDATANVPTTTPSSASAASSESDDASKKWRNWIDNAVGFGPKKVGCNLLINQVPGYENRPSVWPKWAKTAGGDDDCDDDDDDEDENDNDVVDDVRVRENDHSIVSGFQLATNCGPICNEPLMGVAVILLDWRYGGGGGGEKDESSGISSSSSVVPDSSSSSASYVASSAVAVSHGPMSGQLMSAMKEGILKAFNQHPRRLMVAMYSCEIQATAEVLGRMYAVLGKRQGRVEGEELREGSNVFVIRAALPVVESFGFCNEVRKRTSGLASPQLVFSHWEVFDLDPFWVPTTEEEIAHFGQKADSENVARKYMNDVRRRKGLKVEEKIVEFAEKQRTLTKNK